MTKCHFLYFQKWPKLNFWTGKILKTAKNAISQNWFIGFHHLFYLYFFKFSGLLCHVPSQQIFTFDIFLSILKNVVVCPKSIYLMRSRRKVITRKISTVFPPFVCRYLCNSIFCYTHIGNVCPFSFREFKNEAFLPTC